MVTVFNAGHGQLIEPQERIQPAAASHNATSPLRVSNGFAFIGLGCLALAMSSTIFLLVDVVLGVVPWYRPVRLPLSGSVCCGCSSVRQREYAAEHASHRPLR